MQQKYRDWLKLAALFGLLGMLVASLIIDSEQFRGITFFVLAGYVLLSVGWRQK